MSLPFIIFNSELVWDFFVASVFTLTIVENGTIRKSVLTVVGMTFLKDISHQELAVRF